MFRSLCVLSFVGLAGIACADTGVQKEPSAAAAVTLQAQPPAVSAAADSGCLKDTGSRSPQQPGKCLSGPGRSYDADTIDRSGATDAGDALGRLDPSVTIHR